MAGWQKGAAAGVLALLIGLAAVLLIRSKADDSAPQATATADPGNIRARPAAAAFAHTAGEWRIQAGD